MTRRRRLALGGGVLVALTAGIVPALAANRGPTLTPSFTTPLALGKWSGGEPSLAFDPNNPRNLYITAPQSVPAAVNGPLADGSGSQGVGFWASYDGGRTFPNAQNIGSGTGGGDSDVTVGPDGTVYVADLEATAADICVSTDHGHTFTSGNAAKSVDKCGTATTNQQGPEDDRQWLTASSAQDNAIYLTYHDFAAGYPIIERSTDHAATFAPCGQILNATSAAGQNYTATNGTLVAKPTIDRDGRMFVEVTEPPVVSPPVGAALS
ncbi:MAG TPA: hypothetical protein VNE21_07085, partial [Mycobacteriales bacterium]|nr:hypothetical protein [Mycobacteriales bacterium]